MYFPSKKDIGLGGIYWLVIFLFTLPPVVFSDFGVFMLPSFFDTYPVRLTFFYTIAGLLLWIWFRTGYTVTEDWLVIEYGPIQKKVEIETIESIRETKNPFIDPALSINKLQLYYGNGRHIAISPKEKEHFKKQLVKRNPKIKIINQR
ncbi:hypothetical protein E2L07_06940 [Halalkalibacterium halodurans]|uniref:PH domain-containing protein n=1 Tax=Halalkalibacterium halodurans TaxID=86665 RepID=UPI0010682442|nr:PH domain-containing protein [Halalkalibacterium halodurans]MED4122945.1 PH domain-containing protein [Halalkalibacterium halodurans]TES55656.1 hypothetical protein E2L07_06940 [Halalkalibacterium halodurans]